VPCQWVGAVEDVLVVPCPNANFASSPELFGIWVVLPVVDQNSLSERYLHMNGLWVTTVFQDFTVVVIHWHNSY
jgi:hypothetical protein